METLYRKYRSQTFRELVGQAQVTQILRNAIRRGRLSHAYLFCGPRGTGKTSVARIFAKALCCLDPQDGDCCGKCANCQQIAGGQALDVQEIDAASKNKVDDIRELRDRVGYAPAQFPYKIYIIDEVHMVTTQGFNALLKTLEEPPPHVKFLLCTTEAHKLPVTILSRCIRLDFTRIALPELAAHLQWIAAQEGFTLAEDAALELAALAEGSARDAISLLDQLTVYCEGAIARSDVRELFQLGDPDLVPGVADAIAANARRDLLDTWERLTGQGADAGRFLLQVAELLKQRYLETAEPGWRRALEAIWQGLNLLKQESFPALLVELSLLQAAEAFNAPDHAVAASSAPREPAGYAVDTDSPPSRKPDFLRKRDAAPAPPLSLPSEPLPEPPAAAPAAVERFDSALPPPGEQRPPMPPVAAPERPNPALADPRFLSFLEVLKPRSLPAYALASQYAQPALDGGMLELAFSPSQPWGRQACAYAQFDELMSAMAAAAEESYGARRLKVGIAGEEAGWKKHGFPFDPAEFQELPAAAAEPAGAGAHALFAKKAGKPVDVDSATDSFREEHEPEPAQIAGDSQRPGPDPRDPEGDVEQLARQVDRAVQPIRINTPATVEDVLELFGARILPDD